MTRRLGKNRPNFGKSCQIKKCPNKFIKIQFESLKHFLKTPSKLLKYLQQTIFSPKNCLGLPKVAQKWQNFAQSGHPVFVSHKDVLFHFLRVKYILFHKNHSESFHNLPQKSWIVFKIVAISRQAKIYSNELYCFWVGSNNFMFLGLYYKTFLV